jgi:hypothetical protein
MMMRKVMVTVCLIALLVPLTGCQATGNDAEVTALVATNEALQTQLSEQSIALAACLTVPTAQPTPEPTFAPFQATEPPATDTPVAEPTATLQSWRLEIYPESKRVIDDSAASESWEVYVADFAKNLAFPTGYYWEDLEPPAGTRFTDLELYYYELLRSRGYKLASSAEKPASTGGYMYLITYFKGLNSTNSRIAIHFWPKYKDNPAEILIIYSNPQ